MKIFIFCDMEGISGISQLGYVRKGESLYSLGCKLMAQEINACVDACFSAGADDVIVRDGHSSGVNVNPLEIDPRAELIQGASGGCRFPGIDDCDGLILLGYHAMAGTSNAVLEHTFRSDVQNMWIDGRRSGEFALDATIAAEHKVPTIMVSGDDKVCTEAKSLLPDVVTCQVKTSLTGSCARMLSPQRAHELIGKKTCEAIRRLGSFPLLNVASPVTLKIEYVERADLPTPGGKGVLLLDGRTCEITRNTLEEALLS